MEGKLSERRATQTSMELVLATIGRKLWYAILRRNTTVVRTGVYPHTYDRNLHPHRGQTNQFAQARFKHHFRWFSAQWFMSRLYHPNPIPCRTPSFLAAVHGTGKLQACHA